MKTTLRVLAGLAIAYVLGALTVMSIGHLRRTTGAFDVAFHERAPVRGVRRWTDADNGTPSPDHSGRARVEIVHEGNGYTLVLGDGLLAKGCRIHSERELSDSGRWLVSEPRELDIRNARCAVTLADGTPGVLSVGGWFGFGGGFSRQPHASLSGAVRTEHSAPIEISFTSEVYALTF